MKRHRTSICSGTQRNVAESGWPAWVFGGDDVWDYLMRDDEEAENRRAHLESWNLLSSARRARILN